MRRRMATFIAVAMGLIILWMCGGCSAGYHLRRARVLDPSLFDTTVVVSRAKVDLPVVDFDLECPHLGAAPIVLYSPIVDTVEGVIYRDSVRVVFYAVDSSMIRAEVDCPDPEVITKVVTNTVEIPPKPIGILRKLKWAGLGVLLLALLWVASRVVGLFG